MSTDDDRIANDDAEVDPETARLLDVAREEFISHGFRRTSIGEIAQRAGVSRRTVHRRLGEKDDIVAAVVERDIQEFLVRVAQSAIARTAPEVATVEAFVLGIRECRTHPLVAAVLEYEPETLHETAFGNSETLVRIRSVIALLMALDGSLDPDSAHEVAELVIRITLTLLIAPSAVLPTGTDDEARHLATKYFVPLITAAKAQARPLQQ
ncbi:TetR/AcrR family transcriptional regulator [Nocardia sp. NPDC058379]|uniref:TetR/AcrR family transcriptional regulator n=1 Tax=unclassified Nocardia TaxID=2637762 RepID=UPI0036546395